MGIWDNIKGVIGTAAPFFGPLGGVASTLIDAASQRHSNTANAEQAQRQMDFQREQSSTQYQRGVKDMQAAGLNPALAYQQGGDSAGSGASATIAPTSQNTTSKFATALQTYNDIATSTAQRGLLREQTNAAQADALYKMQQSAALQPDANLGRDSDYLGKYIQSRRAGAVQTTQAAGNYPARFKAEISNLNANTATAQAQAANLRSQTTLNEQGFQNEWFRKNINPYLQSTASTIKPFVPVMRFYP